MDNKRRMLTGLVQGGQRTLAGVVAAALMIAQLTLPPRVEASALGASTLSTWTPPPLPRDITTRFVYDGDGGRVQQITASGTTTFLGESVEIGPDGTVTKSFFAGAQRLASLSAPPRPRPAASSPKTRTPPSEATLQPGKRFTPRAAQSPQPPAPSLRYYHGDHLGSTSLVTDQSGQVVEMRQYTPYGSVVAPSPQPAASSPFGFTGQRLDASTGLYFFHARYYDPELGRFLQPDTIVQAPGDPQTLNRYAYARNNPVRYVDPSGYGFWSAFFGAIAAAFTFVLSSGNFLLAAGVFGAVNGGISAYQAGAGWSGAFMAAGIGFTAGYIGAGVGAGVSGAAGGGWFGGTVGGAIGGATAGSVAAALSGGSIGQGASAGAASGAFFGGTYNFSPQVAMLGSAVVGAVAAGADPVDALVEGAGSYAGTYVGGYAAGYAKGNTVPADGQLEPLGVQKGDPLFFLGPPLDLAKFVVGLLDGPFSHTNIYVGNGQVADNNLGRAADIVSLAKGQFQGRRFVSFRGAPGAANLDYQALTKNYATANGRYNPWNLNVCSTFCTAIYGAGGVAYPHGIGPNAQFINRLREQ